MEPIQDDRRKLRGETSNGGIFRYVDLPPSVDPATKKHLEWSENYIRELEAERDSLVAYLGETADAIENHNVKRKQVAALLRKTQARYR